MSLTKFIFSVNFRTELANDAFVLLCVITLLLISGDVKLNHGPKKIKSYYKVLLSYYKVSLFRWKLYSITAHNFCKISLFAACNA